MQDIDAYDDTQLILLLAKAFEYRTKVNDVSSKLKEHGEWRKNKGVDKWNTGNRF